MVGIGKEATSLQRADRFLIGQKRFIPFQVTRQTSRFLSYVGNAKIVERTLHVVQFRCIELLVRTEGSFDGRIGFEVGDLGCLPLAVRGRKGQIGIVVLAQREALIDGNDLVIANADRFDIVAAKFEQIRFDPLFEIGTEWSGIKLDNIDDVFGWNTHKALIFVIVFSDDQVGENVTFCISHLNQHADPFTSLVRVLLIGLDDSKKHLIRSLGTGDTECLEPHEKIGRLAHLFGRIRRVAFMRRNGPNSGLAILSNFEFNVVFFGLVVAKNLERRRRHRIGKFFKHRCSDSARDWRVTIAARGSPGQQSNDTSDDRHRSGFGSFCHFCFSTLTLLMLISFVFLTAITTLGVA